MTPDDALPMTLGRGAVIGAALAAVLVAFAFAVMRPEAADLALDAYDVLPFAFVAAVLGEGLALGGLAVALMRRRPVPSTVASGVVLNVVVVAIGAGALWLGEQLNAAW